MIKHMIYEVNVSDKREVRRERKNTVLMIMEEGSIRTLRRTFMKRLTIVGEAKEISRERVIRKSILSGYSNGNNV